MLDVLKLECLWIPSDRVTTRNKKFLFKHSETTPQCDIYVSKDFFENKNKLLVLIQGTGNVRAGYIILFKYI